MIYSSPPSLKTGLKWGQGFMGIAETIETGFLKFHLRFSSVNYAIKSTVGGHRSLEKFNPMIYEELCD